jgi:YegS/Rv2252/BmrU family lipid kinase
MEHIFIINPIAGKGKAAHSLQQKIKGIMDPLGLSYQIYVTKAAGDATDYVAGRCRMLEDTEQISQSPDEIRLRFYACGGDGTLNEVVNGAARSGRADVSVTSYPCGTGNDFIKNFPAADFSDIGALILARDLKIDLLRIDDHYAVNICNIGFDAEIAFHTDKFKKLPFIDGSMAYTVAIFYCLMKKTRYPFELEVDGKAVRNEYLLTVLANGQYYGGAYQAAPLAKVSDGRMDFIGVLKMPRWKMLSVLRLYKEGLHLDSPKIRHLIQHETCRSFKLRSKEPVPVSLDGDILQASEVSAEIVPGILNFAVPRTDGQERKTENREGGRLL